MENNLRNKTPVRRQRTPIVVPYNFAPVSSWFFRPGWADQVSSDIPFEDGISGRIDYELTNSSPLCVGHRVEMADKSGVKHLIWEKDHEGRYVIPGSSVKGMLRNALEIVSFCRMSFFHDRKHAFRLSISDVKGEKSRFDLAPVFVRPKVNAPGTWEYLAAVAEPDDKPVSASVSAESLGRILNVTPAEAATMTAKEKYRKLYGVLGLGEDEPMPLLYAVLEKKEGYSAQQRKKLDKGEPARKTTWKEVTEISLNSDKPGAVPGMFLFMDKNISNDGSPNKPNPKANHFTDYFFYVDSETAHRTGDWQKLPDYLVSDLNDSMALVKADDSGVKEENLFNYVRSRMNRKYGFPVWYLMPKSSSGKGALGFCQVVRKVADRSVGDLINDNYKNFYGNSSVPGEEAYDLADLMFGCVRKNAPEGSLGSRIGFSDLRSSTVPGVFQKTYVMGEPKPTFYEAYLGDFGFREKYSKGNLIAGRKIYKVRKDLELARENANNDNVKVQTRIDFVDRGASFAGSVVFHNLKPAELGALLWVMTFGNSSDPGLYHRLGHAKPMGAGAVQMKITGDSIHIPEYLTDGNLLLPGVLDLPKEDLVGYCITAFEELMGREYPFVKNEKDDGVARWKTSEAVKAYLENARVDENALSDKVYNKFPTTADRTNEFAEIAKDFNNTPAEGGFYPGGKHDGYAADCRRQEKDFTQSKFEELLKRRAKLAPSVAPAKKTVSATPGEFKDVFDSSQDPMFILATAFGCPSLRESLKDKADAGLIPGDYLEITTCYQMLKRLGMDTESQDEPALIPLCEYIAKLRKNNEQFDAEVKEFIQAVKKKGKYKYQIAKVLASMK